MEHFTTDSSASNPMSGTPAPDLRLGIDSSQVRRRDLMLRLAIIVCMALAAASARAQAPQLGFPTPWAAAPGKAVDITFAGANLAGPTGFWNSFGATAELAPGIDQNGAKPGEVVYRLSLPADAPVG